MSMEGTLRDVQGGRKGGAEGKNKARKGREQDRLIRERREIAKAGAGVGGGAMQLAKLPTYEEAISDAILR